MDLEENSARMRKNLELRTGKSFAAWVNIARKLGTPKITDIVAYLKLEGPMSHGYAMMVANASKNASEIAEEDPVDALFAGSKIVLRPVYDAIVKSVGTFGRDIEFQPKKGYVSMRRGKQFAMVQPSTDTRIDIGLNLKETVPEGRLEASGKWNGMVSHRIRIGKPEDFDLEVKRWLKLAYDQAAQTTPAS